VCSAGFVCFDTKSLRRIEAQLGLDFGGDLALGQRGLKLGLSEIDGPSGAG